MPSIPQDTIAELPSLPALPDDGFGELSAGSPAEFTKSPFPSPSSFENSPDPFNQAHRPGRRDTPHFPSPDPPPSSRSENN